MSGTIEGVLSVDLIKSHEQCTETIFGVLNSEEECLKVIDMSRLCILPRIKSRLTDNERNAIRPGSIYVYEEEESGISRWTDSKAWSSSKIHGKCLIYYELEDTPYDERLESLRYDTTLENVLSMGKEIVSYSPQDKRARKKNGLIKMTTSLVYERKSYHLLSYFTESFSKKYPRGPVWDMVYAWEIPANLFLRMNYRRKRKTNRSQTEGSAKPIRIRRRDEKRSNSFPSLENKDLFKDAHERLDLPTDLLDDCSLSNNEFFTF